MFKFFKKSKKEEQVIINYDNLIELTKILTENDDVFVNKITLLVKDANLFSNTYSDLLEYYGYTAKEDKNNITLFILSDYYTPKSYGVYCDWKEDPEEILGWLEKTVKNKKYKIDFKGLEFTTEEETLTGIEKIKHHLEKDEYTLLDWDSGGDCYNLFIVKKEQEAILKKLAEASAIHLGSPV